VPESVLLLEADEAVPRQLGDAPGVGAYPDAARPILGDAVDRPVRQPMPFGVGTEHLAVEFDQPGARADPHPAIVALRQAAYDVRRLHERLEPASFARRPGEADIT
jgi:hypothetical protein